MRRSVFMGPAGVMPFREHIPGSAKAGLRVIQATPALSVELVRGADLAPQAIRWVWRDWLAAGKLHLIAGAAGTGKTTIALSLAATISQGRQWPDGTGAERGSVLIWTGEDGVDDTLLPRYLASCGDPERVHFVKGTTERGKSRPFDPSTDMPQLLTAAKGITDLRLVILDPVVAAVAGDSHKNTETRRGLQPVVDLAGQLDCAVLGVTHFSKSTSGRDPLERVAGSLAFGAVARVVLATVKSADDDAPRRLVRAKSNLGPDSGGFEYNLFLAPVPGHEIHAQSVEWGSVLEGTARELMSIEQPDKESGLQEDAEAFLREFLACGPVSYKEIAAAAKAYGHKDRTLRRAKDSLGVEAVKTAMSGGWSWRLPPSPKVARDAGEDGQQS